jgi:hypothetical protein
MLGIPKLESDEELLGVDELELLSPNMLNKEAEVSGFETGFGVEDDGEDESENMSSLNL